MSLFGQAKRHGPSKPRRSPLPISTAESEKFGYGGPMSPLAGSPRWYSVVAVPVPQLPFGKGDQTPRANGLAHHGQQKTFFAKTPRARRYVRVPVPIPPRMMGRVARLPRIVRIALYALVLGCFSFLFCLLIGKKESGRSTWTPAFMDPDTLVVTPEEVAKIWEWEVLSGHHPGGANVPESVPITEGLINPVVPQSVYSSKDTGPLVDYQKHTANGQRYPLVGKGPARRYITPWDTPLGDPGFPPRPVPGSVMDLDVVMQKCDFGTNQYVRDCLEMLRIGGNLDNGKRTRQGDILATYKQAYMEQPFTPAEPSQWTPLVVDPKAVRAPNLSREPVSLSTPVEVTSAVERVGVCDPEHPRIFHIFWAGAFTDKPYMATMSFLFTQNLGLDRPLTDTSSTVRNACRPQFWIWINPGPAAAVPNPNAKREMFEQLATNPWSAPFLHSRFRDVVKFKMWNTTEQLDGVPELKPYWRDMSIFNSGGNVYHKKEEVKKEEVKKEEPVAAEGGDEDKSKKKLFEKVGSSSANDYDRLSVILSDMARFVLTYRFGGIYLDADTLFLRDWEELWNYRGQFAYRWSWHQKYNTAVLKLHKGSALSKFLFQTALENGLDFHPMTVSRYLKDAGLDPLLVRIPDAVFDPAWLNMERYQRDRPPFPYFPEFSVFFTQDKFETAAPQQVGFDGFFRGAYSYHFHNFWWLPFDPERNYPDLGERFAKGEEALREQQRQESEAKVATATPQSAQHGSETVPHPDDLSWSTVIKRTFEAYLRAERPNMYGEWLQW